MLISDISYIENVSDKNIEGSGRPFPAGAFFDSRKSLDIFGQAFADGYSKEILDLSAVTGYKSVEYKSITEATAKV
ncbi:hypothetical protein [Microcystis aeruginosa]|uniref:Uncharacterized protein n=1 Tax=Microcystis aeruginosa NIES-2521 TaxID=2303983 RepID=A0A5A5RYC3_MICAE|nr:hypothetical protein [Microcystis aeruginosa]GCA79955.1 hypothetical protein MiTs_01956 [Microcystis aeruginosa NIES-2521]